jgi:hypothetical protein
VGAPQCLQNCGKRIQAPGQLGETVHHETAIRRTGTEAQRAMGDLLIRSIGRSRQFGDRSAV